MSSLEILADRPESELPRDASGNVIREDIGPLLKSKIAEHFRSEHHKSFIDSNEGQAIMHARITSYRRRLVYPETRSLFDLKALQSAADS